MVIASLISLFIPILSSAAPAPQSPVNTSVTAASEPLPPGFEPGQCSLVPAINPWGIPNPLYEPISNISAVEQNTTNHILNINAKNPLCRQIGSYNYPPDFDTQLRKAGQLHLPLIQLDQNSVYWVSYNFNFPIKIEEIRRNKTSGEETTTVAFEHDKPFGDRFYGTEAYIGDFQLGFVLTTKWFEISKVYFGDAIGQIAMFEIGTPSDAYGVQME